MTELSLLGVSEVAARKQVSRALDRYPDTMSSGYHRRDCSLCSRRIVARPRRAVLPDPLALRSEIR